jgi:hypothetical protein
MAIDFEAFDLDLDGETDEEPEKPPRVTLEELAARPGQAGALARELLEIRKEREAKAETERLAAEAEATLTAGEPDFEDPIFLEGLRASVLAQRATSDASYIAGMRRLREGQFGAETADRMLRDEADRSGRLDAWLTSSDPLHDHPAYRDHQRQQVEAARAREAARMGRVGFKVDLEEAEAYIEGARAKALGADA